MPPPNAEKFHLPASLFPMRFPEGVHVFGVQVSKLGDGPNCTSTSPSETVSLSVSIDIRNRGEPAPQLSSVTLKSVCNTERVEKTSPLASSNEMPLESFAVFPGLSLKSDTSTT